MPLCNADKGIRCRALGETFHANGGACFCISKRHAEVFAASPDARGRHELAAIVPRPVKRKLPDAYEIRIWYLCERAVPPRNRGIVPALPSPNCERAYLMQRCLRTSCDTEELMELFAPGKRFIPHSYTVEFSEVRVSINSSVLHPEHSPLYSLIPLRDEFRFSGILSCVDLF